MNKEVKKGWKGRRVGRWKGERVERLEGERVKNKKVRISNLPTLLPSYLPSYLPTLLPSNPHTLLQKLIRKT